MAPHVYNIAHECFWGLKEFGLDQSVIVSGESGAGKTEATKTCLSYLAMSAGSVANVREFIFLAF
jgi:myosin heavy subunit